jgi:hypothetical protein
LDPGNSDKAGAFSPRRRQRSEIPEYHLDM